MARIQRLFVAFTMCVSLPIFAYAHSEDRMYVREPGWTEREFHDGASTSSDRTLESYSIKAPVSDPAQRALVLERYKHLDPSKIISRKIFETAVLTFDANLEIFPNKRVITIVDFSKKSNKARWFHIDMKNGSVWPLRVAHGRGSDTNADGYPEKFSNIHNSKMSSLGVYRTAESYNGEFGYSLRVDGLSSTNSNARARAIVIHPAWYVWESTMTPGMTEGCFGLSKKNAKAIVDSIKNGAMVFVGTSASM